MTRCIRRAGVLCLLLLLALLVHTARLQLFTGAGLTDSSANRRTAIQTTGTSHAPRPAIG